MEFPPTPLDIHLTNVILQQACSKMQPQHVTEAGCAVCGKLKPSSSMSRLKSIKRQLDILAASGVSCIKRNDASRPICEYKGPILDYSCSKICHPCHASTKFKHFSCGGTGPIHKPLAKASLGILLFLIEKLLVACIHHTCAYVKVASGMRKMTANVIAFQSPIPKVYNVLPPSHEDLNDVLAILYTGPCKPTADDLQRLPFFV